MTVDEDTLLSPEETLGDEDDELPLTEEEQAEYPPYKLQKIKKALRQYRRDHCIPWSKYHGEIIATLIRPLRAAKIKSNHKIITDYSVSLNEKDPKRWLENRNTGIKKLRVYDAFVQTLGPEYYRGSDSQASNIKLGVSLADFVEPVLEVHEELFKKCATSLDRTTYVKFSSSAWHGSRDISHHFEFICLKAIPKTFLLQIFNFRLKFDLDILVPGANYLTHKGKHDDIDNKLIVKLMNNLQDLKIDRNIPIINYRVGVVAPINTISNKFTYCGMMKGFHEPFTIHFRNNGFFGSPGDFDVPHLEVTQCAPMRLDIWNPKIFFHMQLENIQKKVAKMRSAEL